MKEFIKSYWKTLLFFAIIGLLGGFFTGLYLFDSYPEDIKQQLIQEVNSAGLSQIPVDVLLGVVTAIQSAIYGIVFGGLGIIIAKKIGLWKDEKHIIKKHLIISIVIAFIGGLALILPDTLFFSKYSRIRVCFMVISFTFQRSAFS